MLKTRVCEILGIEFPILQSPMNWVTTPELVSTVSNAGGLGILDGNSGNDGTIKEFGLSAEGLREQVRRTRELTTKPFAVNIGGAGGKDEIGKARTEAIMRVILEEKIPVVYTSGGSPEPLTKRLHEVGIKVVHIVVSVRHAKKAQAVGVDVIAVGGYEAGGHSAGVNEIPVLTLLPQVADVVSTPLLAGGGIGDARGLIAAFALGAEGIAMGTRFAATKESRLHPRVKQAIVEATDDATIVWGRKAEQFGVRPDRDIAKVVLGRGGGGLSRTYRNMFTEKYSNMESGETSLQDLVDFVEDYADPSGKALDRTAGAILGGDIDWGEAYMGAVSGLVREIISAADVISGIVRDVDSVMARLNKTTK